MERFCLGLDIGSISVNTVLIDAARSVVEDHYTFCHGRPFHALREVLCDLLSRHPASALEQVAITGTGWPSCTPGRGRSSR
jgi:activator of 2-hydroxyglutaryl-CoA dehydratase